ncbi:MAG: hypothetical protein RL226_242 [Bacteroidota bacterium]
MAMVLVAFSVFSQGTIKGFVKDKKTGEPVIFASVVLVGTNYGVSTDVTGYYTLSKIPAGSYTLKVSSLEYEDATLAVEVADGKVITRNFEVASKIIQLGGAEISADKAEQETQVRISVETIRPADIKRIPSFGGQADLVQVLQVLPGFVSTGDQGGQLYIRGGSPVQNMVLMDGMIVYNAFHSIGLFSVFDSDIIANADVYSGGFGAEFGGRVSSVMDITTRDGNKKEHHGKIGGSPFGAKLMVEGPLRKATEEKGGISYILSAKRSYLEQSSKLFYTYIDSAGLPFNFTDIYGKISFGGKGGSKFNLFGFSFADDVQYQALSKLNWKNYGGGGNFVVVPAGSAVLINGNFASSRYEITLKEDNLPDRFSAVNGFNFGLDFKYIRGDDELKYGIQVVGLRTDFQTFNALGVGIEQTDNSTQFGGYFDYKISAGDWIIEPSIRLQYYSDQTRMSPEPRLGMKYKVSPVFRVKMAGGIYSQNLISANSDRDVVNLFYGFMTAPQDLQDEVVLPNGEVKEIKHALQMARHAIVGFEWDITEEFNLNVEGYVKDFNQLTNINRNKLFPDDGNNPEIPDELKKDFIVETGLAQGLDFLLKYEQKHRSVWLVYSLSNIDRWDGNRWYDPVFDRRHNINFVASQAFGEDHTWELSTRWNLGSGLPFTQTQGYYQEPSVANGVGTDYVIDNSNQLAILYGGLNEGRLPYYHRLDINLRKTYELKNDVTLEFNAGVTNVYSRKNVFYINRVTGERVDQLPFLPSLGFEFSF